MLRQRSAFKEASSALQDCSLFFLVPLIAVVPEKVIWLFDLLRHACFHTASTGLDSCDFCRTSA